MFRVSPSIASCDLCKIGEELTRIEGQYQDLHVDIEDGNFTPNITFGLKTIQAIRESTQLPFSIHLMVSNPLDYIEPLSKLSCSVIFVHGESSQYLKRIFYSIHQKGIRAGLALNPCSDIKNYQYLFDDIEAVLYLTSEIDGQGELFQRKVIDKMINVPKKEIWADGGLNQDTIPLLPEYIDVIVQGRAVFRKD